MHQALPPSTYLGPTMSGLFFVGFFFFFGQISEGCYYYFFFIGRGAKGAFTLPPVFFFLFFLFFLLPPFPWRFKPKYIYSSVFIDLTPWSKRYSVYIFWHFFALHTNRKRCNQEGFCPCHSKCQIVYSYHTLSLFLQGFVCSKYHF